MGAGNGKREIKKYNDRDMNSIPNDQYVCTKCDKVPEIKGIDFNNFKIEINCKKHKINILPIKEYINKQSNYLYYNDICDANRCNQRDFMKEIFYYCFDCQKKYCQNCLKNNCENSHKAHRFPVNKINSICQKHYMPFFKYCKNCEEQICKKYCPIDKNHNVVQIEPAKKDIEYLKNKRHELIQNIENLESLKKLLDIVLETQEKHSSNYYHNINISNLAESLKKKEDIKLFYEKKIKHFESIILEYLNSKLQVDLKGDEKEINLSGREIAPNDFKLLSLIAFPNLEVINLSNNNISDISLLNNFKLTEIKAIDLSYNKIKYINFLQNLSENAIKLERLFLNIFYYKNYFLNYFYFQPSTK